MFSHGIKSVTYLVQKQKSSTILLYSMVCSTMENKELLVLGMKTISITNRISKKHEMKIFQIALVKLFPTTMTFTL